MSVAVYNAAIPELTLNTVHRRLSFSAVFLSRIFGVIFALAIYAQAADWNAPEQQLARKISGVTGPGAMALTVTNRSSLGRRDSEVIRNGLRSALEAAGLRVVKAEQAAATITVTLSENPTSYVWVAEIRQGAGDSAVEMVTLPRPEGSVPSRDAVPLSLRKSLLWTQSNPILDLTVLEDGATPSSIAVLSVDDVSLYGLQGGKWQQQEHITITPEHAWPRDLRGRLLPAKDHLLDVYLPGVQCKVNSGPASLSCRESDDPWPLLAGGMNGGALASFPSAGLSNGATTVVPQVRAFYASNRNFFTGALTPGLGKFTTVPKFYSAAVLPREKYPLWLFAATDGEVHFVDGLSDQVARVGWGSDLTSVKTSCGAGWQVLATSSSEAADSVRAYELPDRDPVGVSAAVDFPGAITALWTEARGDTAIVVVKNRDTRSYEAFRLAIACDQ